MRKRGAARLWRSFPGWLGYTLIEIMIVVGIFAIVMAIAFPSWYRARSQSRMKVCQENLQKMDSAKEQWALENNQQPGTPVTFSDIVTGPQTTGYIKFIPEEPSGGTYNLNPVGTSSTCDTGYPGHSLSEIGLVITELEYN